MVPAQEPRYLLRSDHPQVAVTWSTSILSDRPKPDALKLRKRVTAWPLEFTFKVGAEQACACAAVAAQRRVARAAVEHVCTHQKADCCCQQARPEQAPPGFVKSTTAAYHHLMVQADYHTASREFTYGMMCRVGISKLLPRCRCCCCCCCCCCCRCRCRCRCRCCCPAAAAAVHHRQQSSSTLQHRGCGCMRPAAACVCTPWLCVHMCPLLSPPAGWWTHNLLNCLLTTVSSSSLSQDALIKGDITLNMPRQQVSSC